MQSIFSLCSYRLYCFMSNVSWNLQYRYLVDCSTCDYNLVLRVTVAKKGQMLSSLSINKMRSVGSPCCVVVGTKVYQLILGRNRPDVNSNSAGVSISVPYFTVPRLITSDPDK